MNKAWGHLTRNKPDFSDCFYYVVIKVRRQSSFKFKLTNFFQIEWLGSSLKPVYSDLQFLSTPLVFFYWKNLLSAFHTILMKLETIIKKKNKKKQLENPFRKSSISQLCTKYWSRLTFLINISLHSIKAWGHLTLIETNLDSLAHGFLWVSISRIRDRWQLFSHQTKRNSSNKKKAAGCNFNRER